jgi:hypothetical protein
MGQLIPSQLTYRQSFTKRTDGEAAQFFKQNVTGHVTGGFVRSVVEPRSADYSSAVRACESTPFCKGKNVVPDMLCLHQRIGPAATNKIKQCVGARVNGNISP